MTSKNLFSVSLRENLKRRIWVVFAGFLILFLCFPGAMSLSLNSVKTYTSQEQLPATMLEQTQYFMSLNEGLFFFVTCLGAFAGLQAFAWLHQRKKVDFYHSQPVTRQFRFWVTYVNGILIFVVCYLINLLLGMAVAAGYGSLTGEIVLQGMISFGLFTLLYLCMYHLGILAVLMTGNIVIAVMALGTFCLYEFAVRGLIVSYQELFFHSYSYRSSEGWYNTFTCPIEIFTRVTAASEGYVSDSFGRGINGMLASLGVGEVVWLIVIAAVTLGLIFWLYGIRPSESYGKSISFAVTKEPIRILLLIPISLAGGIVIYSASGNSIVFCIIGILFTALLGHMLLQIAFELDIRSVFCKKASLAISGAAALLIFVVFWQDLTGYDEYLPNKTKVESVSLRFHIDDTNQGYTWVEEDGREISGDDYILSQMHLTDLDTVYALLEQKADFDEFEEDGIYEENETGKVAYHYLTVAWHLKNGSVKYREIAIDHMEHAALIDDVWRLPQYRASTQQIISDNFLSAYKIKEMSFYNGIRNIGISQEDFAAIAEAYRADMEAVAFTETYHARALGVLQLQGEGLRSSSYTNQWGYLIFDSYTHTIAAMERVGIEYDSYIPQEIASMEVIYTDYEAAEEAMRQGEIQWDDYRVTHTYTDPEKIRAILEASVPEDVSHWSMNSDVTEENYQVRMLCPSMYGGEDMYRMKFLSGRIPAFAMQH